jgi:hypothetical protein
MILQSKTRKRPARHAPTALLLSVISLSALSLAGCGDFYWEKPGAGDPEFQRDSSACRQQSANGQWENCMKSRGWTYTAGW